MTKTRLNLALIGTGRIGRVHAGNIAKMSGARLVGIADVNQASARECAAAHGVTRVTSEYRELLNSEGVDAVVVCSSTDTHTSIIEDAARAGKHVFCEKPIDFDLRRIDGALAAVDAAGVRLQIGFNRRFDANHQRVRRAVVDGEVGEPHLLHIISRDPSPPPAEYIKVSGGMFLDMTIHDFDMARFLMGSEVTEVYVSAEVRVDPEIGKLGDVDTAVTLLKFENGAIGTIDNSRQAVYGYDQRVEVFGSRGSVRSENQFPSATTISDDHSVRRDLPLNFFMDRYRESFAAEMASFVDAVLEGRQTLVTGSDARAPVVLGLAAQRSHDEHRPVRPEEVDI